MTEDAVESVARKFSGGFWTARYGLRSTTGVDLKLGEDSKRLSTSMETFVDWLSNDSPPWAAYSAFMSSCLIALDKQPSVHPVGVEETWRCNCAKVVPKFKGTEVTM